MLIKFHLISFNLYGNEQLSFDVTEWFNDYDLGYDINENLS